MLICAVAMLAQNPSGDFAREVSRLLPTEGTPLFPLGVEALKARGGPDLVASTTEGGVLRVRVLKAGRTAYEVEASTDPSLIDIKSGDSVFAAFEVRSTEGGRETGEGLFSLYGQQSAPPWEGLGTMSASLGRTWRRLYYSAKATRDFPKGGFMLTFHLAQQPQTLEFRNFACWNLGPGVDLAKLPYNRVVYQGQEPNAPWRKKAAQMIEQNRKAPLTIKVTRGGKPVPNALVEVKMTKHEYPFGTFLDYNPLATDADAAKYRELVPKLFNRVTVPIYWADWGWENESERKSYFDRFAWSKANGFRMKAHNLVWPSFRWSPTRLQSLRSQPDALRRTIVNEARERATLLSSQPFENIDVLNELRTEYEFGDLVGKSLYKDIFDIAKEAWPRAELVYNDFDVFEGGGLSSGSREATKAIIRRLIADKVPVNTLGWQGHFGESLTPPETVWALLDEFREFKMPLEITEFDVETRDERAQADYTRDLLTAWFAHPTTVGFTMWGFYEGKHWKPAGAMFRRDWTPKPMHDEWVRLTQKVWSTQERVRTARSGTAVVRGFRGDYQVTVTVGQSRTTKVLRLTGKGSTAEIKL
jgi:endo-1,4-beta-xylanase